jgi:hypothetical protein
MSVSAKYNTVLTQISASKRLGLLLKRCLQQFRVRYGSLSFFDNNYENFKLESGYHDKRINRELSIAAHALYSSEVLVIPDTHLVCATTSSYDYIADTVRTGALSVIPLRPASQESDFLQAHPLYLQMEMYLLYSLSSRSSLATSPLKNVSCLQSAAPRWSTNWIPSSSHLSEQPLY